jgi:hypothetical protein
MDYYQYQTPKDVESTISNVPEKSGKSIDPRPILRLLLEPRSLVITHGALYAEHLHGIVGARRDIFLPLDYEQSHMRRADNEQDSTQVVYSRDIANRELLGDASLRDELGRVATLAKTKLSEDLAHSDGVMELERYTRTSLTCRVVEKTAATIGKLMKLK